MFSSVGRAAVLNGASSFAYLSLHSAWPTSAGLNEIAGVARAAVTLDPASSNGHKRRGTHPGMTVPGLGQVVSWVGAWSALTGGNFQGCVPVGGHPLEFYVVLSSNRVVIPGGHNWADGETVVFFGDTPPAPLVEGTTYYLRDVLSDQVRIAASSGGAAITLTAAAGPQCVIAGIVPRTIASAQAVVTVPQFFLRMIRNHNPVWTGSSSISMLPGTTFDLKTICSDANADTLVFGLQSGSLPTGVTLDPGGVLTCAVGAPPATLTGVTFYADDQIGD